MPDRSIQKVLREVKTSVFEAAVLYADKTARVRIRTNLSHRLYQYIVEDWEFMYNDPDRSIESMRTILTVCRRLQNSGEIIVPEYRGASIDIRIYSKKELVACKKLPENTVVISFYDPLDSNGIPLGSSLNTHSIFSISLEDIDFDDLTDSGIPYADFFQKPMHLQSLFMLLIQMVLTLFASVNTDKVVVLVVHLQYWNIFTTLVLLSSLIISIIQIV